MIEDVRIPKLGMSTVEVDVLEVLVTPGDDVSAGEGLLEIEGEKTTLVLEAPVSGRVLEGPRECGGDHRGRCGRLSYRSSVSDGLTRRNLMQLTA